MTPSSGIRLDIRRPTPYHSASFFRVFLRKTRCVATIAERVDESLIGQEIEVCGWVHRRRDHGGVIFIDLRDREGLLQVVFDPDRPEIFAEAERIRSEYVLQVKGLVRPRPEGTVNPNMRTGQVEVLAHELEILNSSETPPFHHDEQANEELRLKYRYLDLRRENMLGNLLLRHKVTMAMRNYLDGDGFVDVETPMLTRATPEGARDYIVPSRTNPGKFFALPQSPQTLQTASDDVGARSLLPDRALLPR